MLAAYMQVAEKRIGAVKASEGGVGAVEVVSAPQDHPGTRDIGAPAVLAAEGAARRRWQRRSGATGARRPRWRAT